MIIRNPILPGFHPDPSIVRVGEDYYLATSTFEWFPGVQLFHSKDLVRWELIGHALTQTTQADLKGLPDSCGIWAPCLSYADGTFYLVYSVVHSFDGVWKDTPNYLVTSNDPRGPWSAPIFLSARGFDGSLFHDSDGSKWFVSMLVDHRQGLFFGGIQMQEYSIEQEQLVGSVHYLTPGSALGRTEGPHLLKKEGYYYLILAEGGTDYDHAVTVARSTDIKGPYEFSPHHPLISSREAPSHPLQRAGHGDFVQTPQGDWFAVFLVGRPLEPNRRCIRGRETAIEAIEWIDNWPVTKTGSPLPRPEFEWQGELMNKTAYRQTLDFRKEGLPLDFQALRRPIEETWCSIQRGQGLWLRGQQSLSSLHDQSLVARRVAHVELEVTTTVVLYSSHFQHMAGLVFYYNTTHYHYLYLTKEKKGDRLSLNRITADNGAMQFEEELSSFDQGEQVVLGASLSQTKLQFKAGSSAEDLELLGQELDASILSDDYVRDGGDQYRAAFTGCFVGLCCQDLAQHKEGALFLDFDYSESPR